MITICWINQLIHFSIHDFGFAPYWLFVIICCKYWCYYCDWKESAQDVGINVLLSRFVAEVKIVFFQDEKITSMTTVAWRLLNHCHQWVMVCKSFKFSTDDIDLKTTCSFYQGQTLSVSRGVMALCECQCSIESRNSTIRLIKNCTDSNGACVDVNRKCFIEVRITT